MRKEFFIAAMFSCIGYVATNITDINPYDKVISVYTPDNILHINPKTHQVYTEDGSVDTIFRKYSDMAEFIEDYTYESVAYLQDEEEEIFNQKVYSKSGSTGDLMYLSDDKIVFNIDGAVYNVMKIKGKWFDHLSREYNVYTSEMMSNGDIVYSVVIGDRHYYFTIKK